MSKQITESALKVENSNKAGTKEWLGLSILMLPTILLSLDITVLHLALPHLATALRANSVEQLWILDIYGFMIAGFLVTMGTLGDRIGRKRLLLIGASAFGIASIAAAFSTSATMLIITRALLGISGATLMPSTLSLIRNMFHNPKQRTFAISLWMMSFSGGAVMGPLIGGMMLEYFWWGSVFLLGVPVMLLLLVTAPFLISEYKDTSAGRMDFISVIQSLASILLIIYGMKDIAVGNFHFSSIFCLFIGVILGWIFLKRQQLISHPLLELKLFHNKTFSVSLAIMLLGMIIQGGFLLLLAQYLQMVKGLTPLEAGLWMIPFSSGSIIGSLLAPILTRWISRIHVIAIGLSLSALSCVLISFIDTDVNIMVLIISSALFTLGFAPLFVFSTDLIVGSVPPEKSGTAASLSEMSGELGMALGVAIIGSITTFIYRQQIIPPPNIPENLAEQAKDTITGAVGVVEQLSNETGVELLLLAKSSFITALNVVGIINSLVLIILIIIILKVFQPTKN